MGALRPRLHGVEFFGRSCTFFSLVDTINWEARWSGRDVVRASRHRFSDGRCLGKTDAHLVGRALSFI